MLHDTEFSYQREKPGATGITQSINRGRAHPDAFEIRQVAQIAHGLLGLIP